jgi:hypothetical protein
MDYTAGSMYRQGWEDRQAGRPAKPGQTVMGILLEEYNRGYYDCHEHIMQSEKNAKAGSLLQGHPFYQEAHDQDRLKQVFLSD